MRAAIALASFCIAAPVWAQQLPVPQITLIDPNSAPVGSTVPLRVIGSGFLQGYTIVWFAGTFDQFGTRLQTSFVSPRELRATVPASLLTTPGNPLVRVASTDQRCGSGGCLSNAMLFTITANLQLTQILPDRATVGATVSLRAIGNGFATSAFLVWRRNGAETVLPTTFLSIAELRATIPSTLLDSPGIADVFVVNGTKCDGPCPRSNTRPFTIDEALRLTRIDPDRAPTRLATDAPQDVRLFGSGFATSSQAFWRAGAALTQLQTAFVSRNELIAQIPGALLTVPANATIFVRNPGTALVTEVNSNELAFTVFAELRVDRLDPASLPAGSPDSPMTAHGAGFTAATRIQFRDSAGTRTPSGQVVDFARGRIDFVMPAALLAQPTVYDVVAADGLQTSTPIRFTVAAGEFNISSLSPSTLPAGSGDFSLTIAGTGFTSVAQVLLGGTTLTPASVTPTSIRVDVPGRLIANPGDFDVSVRLGTGPESNRIPFRVTAGAVITSLDPREAIAGTGDFDLRIAGRGLTPSPVVRFDGQPVTVLSATVTEVRVRVPGSLIREARRVNVVVSVNQRDSNTLEFTVLPASLTLTLLNPASRPAGSNDFDLTLSGSGLLPEPEVRFAGVALGIVGTQTANAITVRVPASLVRQPGDHPVVVTVQGRSARLDFRVIRVAIPPAALTSANANVPPGGNTTTQVTLSAAAPVDLNGRLDLTFTPDAAGLTPGFIDPAVVFVESGQRILDFTIPAGQTNAPLPGGGRINAGTVAGVISVNLAFLRAGAQDTASLPPPRQIVVPRSAPVLTPGSARLVNSAGGVTVEVQGYSPSREMGNGTVAFTIAGGTDVDGGTSFPVQLQAAFATWFNSAAGRANGSRFLLRIPFPVEGDANRITGFSILLSNGNGQTTATGGR